jgi:hypothetical protein
MILPTALYFAFAIIKVNWDWNIWSSESSEEFGDAII